MLSEKIINLRKSRGWSQEDLAEKLDVSRQSVSKWESGASNPDLDKIVAMSTLFGVSTDYLLKDATSEEREPIRDFVREEEDDDEESGETVAKESLPTKVVSAAECEDYLATVKKAGPCIALGVLLCILAPVALILLGGFADMGILLSESVAAAIGIATLFILVGIAVAIFIINGMTLEQFAYLEDHELILSGATEKNLREEYEENSKKSISRITCGVLLCIFGVLVLVLTACLFQENNVAILLGIAALFGFVAIGTYLIVRTCYWRGAYQKLLQIDEYTKRNKTLLHLEAEDGIYWPIVLVLYLATSFLTDAWGATWIIWPVAAILCTPIEILFKRRKK